MTTQRSPLTPLTHFFRHISRLSKGPYRESFAEYCAELQSGALPVLIRCPNAVSDVGINREKWLPNPAVGREGSSAVPHGEMLIFLGRLMGVAIRSQQPLDLDMPSIVWKQLVRSPITRYVHRSFFFYGGKKRARHDRLGPTVVHENIYGLFLLSAAFRTVPIHAGWAFVHVEENQSVSIGSGLHNSVYEILLQAAVARTVRSVILLPNTSVRVGD